MIIHSRKGVRKVVKTAAPVKEETRPEQVVAQAIPAKRKKKIRVIEPIEEVKEEVE